MGMGGEVEGEWGQARGEEVIAGSRGGGLEPGSYGEADLSRGAT